MRVRTWLCLNLFALGLLLSSQGVARAADDKKTDPTGNWSFSIKTQNGDDLKLTMKLKKEGDKLTGTFNVFNMDVKIENGECKEGNVSFEVSPEVNGNKVVAKFTAKVEGDTIKGKFEHERDGQKVSHDFEAKREKQ